MLFSSLSWIYCRSRPREALKTANLLFVGYLKNSRQATRVQGRNLANWGLILLCNTGTRSGTRSRSITFTSTSPVSKLQSGHIKLYFSTSSNSSIFWRMGDRMSQEIPGLEDTTAEERPNKVNLTDAEWKKKLSPEVYSVCRNHGTERAFTGDLLDNKQKGVYTCGCCGVDLFSSSTKFDSGSGWPSFYDALKDKDVSKLPAVDIKQDNSYGMRRTEVLCGKCSSHLGHVFNDGPQPTGLRYCINSVSLKFKAEKGGGGASNGSSGKNNL